MTSIIKLQNVFPFQHPNGFDLIAVWLVHGIYIYIYIYIYIQDNLWLIPTQIGDTNFLYLFCKREEPLCGMDMSLITAASQGRCCK